MNPQHSATKYPPSVFVSSTCYDLAQVREDLKSFFESLGIVVPILSDSSSFPVDLNRSTIENCLECVKEKANIFILIIGRRYGFETENGKSVTHLEYLEAKAKGIPRYVFVQKSILTAHADWRINRFGDFSEIVDSPKLFEFVELLSDPNENWVHPFESAQEIIDTLRMQLAYLFMDALTIRTKMLGSGLSESLQDLLSGAALLLVVQRPFAWEYRLFVQVLRDEISRIASIKKDLDYGLALGKSVRLGDPAKVIEWVQTKLEEIKALIKSMEVLVNSALPKALGAPGEPSDVEEIVYVAQRMAEVYRSILEWTIEFRRIQVDEKFSHLLELIAQTSHNVIEETEAFVVNYNRQIDCAEQRYKETKQPQSMEIIFKLTCPDMRELYSEICRLKSGNG